GHLHSSGGPGIEEEHAQRVSALSSSRTPYRTQCDLVIGAHCLSAVAVTGLTTQIVCANVALGLPDGSGPRHTRQALISGRPRVAPRPEEALGCDIAWVASPRRLSFLRFRHNYHRSTAIFYPLDRDPKESPYRWCHGNPRTPLHPLGRGRCDHPAQPSLASLLRERGDSRLRQLRCLDACPPAVGRRLRRY